VTHPQPGARSAPEPRAWHGRCKPRPGEEIAMKRLITTLGLVAVLGTSLSACVVREQRVATGPRCRGGFWVAVHSGRHSGRWHRGHWRCPGEVERFEID